MKKTKLQGFLPLWFVIGGLLLFQFSCGAESQPSSEPAPEVATENAAPSSSAPAEAEPEPKTIAEEGVIKQEEICAEIEDYSQCMDAIEQTLFENHSDVFEALEGGFKVKVLEGEDQIFLSNTGNLEIGEDYVEYRPSNYYTQTDMAFVSVGYYEGGSYQLVSRRKGKTYELFNAPHFSPNLKHFVTINADIVAGFEENGFEIWATREGDPQRLRVEMPNEWAPESILWLDNTSFEICRYSYNDNMEKVTLPALLIAMDSEGKWREQP